MGRTERTEPGEEGGPSKTKSQVSGEDRGCNAL